MKCQECGTTIEEGKLYCAKCGKEIQMVPVFESEIENSIQETLTAVAEDFSREDEIIYERPARQKYFYWILGLLIMALLSLSTMGIVIVYQNNSYEYQLETAKEFAAASDYANAVKYANNALLLNGKDIFVRLFLADCYIQNKEPDNARIILREIISMDSSNEEAYRKLIALYENEKDYEAINKLLLASESDEIIKTFQKYIAYPPEFSYKEGNYNEVISLKLSSNTSGIIYYTLDGTAPDQNSLVYTSPLPLDNGKYEIKSVFVNDYGVKSKISTKKYFIDVTIPASPVIKPESGTYHEPTMITAQVPPQCSVYYTLDSSLPTQDSILYTAPIAMPMGDSTFQFIAYSKEGIGGEVTKRNYKLNVETLVSVDQAVNLLVPVLAEKGIILDFDGNLPNLSGRNIYIASTIVTIDDIYCYLVVEYYVDLLGTYTKTGNIYGVGANNGILYKITANPDGSYTAAYLN